MRELTTDDVRWAKEFSRAAAHSIGISPDDAEGAALLGLVQAAQRWDPARGEFRRFARYRVRGEIVDEARRLGIRREAWHRGERERPLTLSEGPVDGVKPAPGADEPLLESEETAEFEAVLAEVMSYLKPAHHVVLHSMITRRTPGEVERELGVSQSRVSQLRQDIRVAIALRTAVA